MKLTTVVGFGLGVATTLILAVTAPVKIVVGAFRGTLIRRPRLG